MFDSEFKDTRLGRLPSNWDVNTLGYLADKGVIWLKNGYAQGEFNQDSIGIPHLRPFNISSAGSIDLSLIKYVSPPEDNSPYWLQQGDVIFNNTNSEELVGKTGYLEHDGDFVLSNHMTIIRVIDPDVINGYWLSKQMVYLWRVGLFRAMSRRHVNQASISLERLRSIPIPLPPLPEQRAIAQVLTTVRQAIEATERVIAAARELKRSLMKYLFTYGPVPVDQADQVKLKDTEIGAVPDGWFVVKIEDVTRELRERNTNLEYGRDEVLSISNVSGFFPSERTLGVDFSKYKIISYRQFGYNPMRLNVGSIAFRNISRPGLVSPDYIIFETVEDKLYPEFFNQFRKTHLWRNQIQMSGQGSVRIRYYYRHIRDFYIPVPSIIEQHEISYILEAAENKLMNEIYQKQTLENLFHSLLHHLMTGKLRVSDILDFEISNQEKDQSRE